jgi:hypothetical protein
VITVAAETSIGRGSERFLQTERYERLRRHLYISAPRQNLSARPSSGAHAGANRCALSTTSDGTNNRAKDGTPTDILARTAICAKALAFLGRHGTVICFNAETAAIDADGLEIQCVFVITDLPDDHFDIRATWNGHLSPRVAYIFIHGTRKNSSITVSGIDLLVCPHRNNCARLYSPSGLCLRGAAKW